MTRAITRFQGEYRWLSNFWPAGILYDGFFYMSTESAYQAAKARTIEERAEFIPLSAKEAKRKGKHLDIRDDWNQVKLKVMEDLLRLKFNPVIHPDLYTKLIETGNAELIEGNTWGDTFWGVCKGKGENHLGRLIMKIREELWLDQ